MLRQKEHHTSVVRLLELNWNLAALTARGAAASTPLAAVDFASEPAFGKPPSLPEPGLEWGTWQPERQARFLFAVAR